LEAHSPLLQSTPRNRYLKKFVLGQVTLIFALAYFALSPTAESGATDTALGGQALKSNTTGANDTALGYQALLSNMTGNSNTATGSSALKLNDHGYKNTADGRTALFSNTNGHHNTAIGFAAMYNDANPTINSSTNTAVGADALYYTSGSNNTALGQNAGSNLTTGNNNIDIGNVGVAGESNTIRIGGDNGGGYGSQTATFIAGIFEAATSDIASTTAVVIDMNGNLGTTASAERFKKDVGPMDQASEAILALKPVTFHYKNDSKGIPQFGLIAEEVAKVT